MPHKIGTIKFGKSKAASAKSKKVKSTRWTTRQSSANRRRKEKQIGEKSSLETTIKIMLFFHILRACKSYSVILDSRKWLAVSKLATFSMYFMFGVSCSDKINKNFFLSSILFSTLFMHSFFPCVPSHHSKW